MDLEYAKKWYDMLIKEADVMPQLTQDRFFLSQGKPGHRNSDKNAENLKHWVLEMLPPKGEHTSLKLFDKDAYMQCLRNSRSKFSIEQE